VVKVGIPQDLRPHDAATQCVTMDAVAAGRDEWGAFACMGVRTVSGGWSFTGGDAAHAGATERAV